MRAVQTLLRKIERIARLDNIGVSLRQIARINDGEQLPAGDVVAQSDFQLGYPAGQRRQHVGSTRRIGLDRRREHHRMRGGTHLDRLHHQLVTQRRFLGHLQLAVSGDDNRRWLRLIARAVRTGSE